MKNVTKILGAIGVSVLISSVSVGATLAVTWSGKADLDAVYKLAQEYVQTQQTTISDLEKEVKDLEHREEYIQEELAKDRKTLEQTKIDLENAKIRIKELEGQLATAQSDKDSAEAELQQANSDVAQFREDMEALLGGEEKEKEEQGADIPISGGSIDNGNIGDGFNMNSGLIPDDSQMNDGKGVFNNNGSFNMDGGVIQTSNNTNSINIKEINDDVKLVHNVLGIVDTALRSHGDTALATYYVNNAIGTLDTVIEKLNKLEKGEANISSEELEELLRIKDAYYEQSIELSYYHAHYGKVDYNPQK